MNNYNSVTILDTTVDGTPSGNYDGSSQDWYGDAVPAANYYGGQGNIQTITYRVTGFTGIITIQATLNDAPEQALWFDVSSYGDELTFIPSDVYAVTVVGNFAYLRAHITHFSSGTINSVIAAY